MTEVQLFTTFSKLPFELKKEVMEFMEYLTLKSQKSKTKVDTSNSTKKPAKEEERLNLSDFSFAETREMLKDCKTSFADEVIAERRSSV